MPSIQLTGPEKPGGMLEDLVESIFTEAGFDVTRNKYIKGIEIDLLAAYGDRTILLECKQYEKSRLPLKTIIYQWKGKNDVLQSDRVIIIIYGHDITEEELELAQSFGILIWGIDDINYFLSLINEPETLTNSLLDQIQLRERDIAETNYLRFIDLICQTLLAGVDKISEDNHYSLLRFALRKRIITRLKEKGSTVKDRAEHLKFFEKAVPHIQPTRRWFFEKQKKLTEHQIWDETRRMLSVTLLKPFGEFETQQYLAYMERLESGYNEILQDICSDPTQKHRKLLTGRLLLLKKDDTLRLSLKINDWEHENISLGIGRVGLNEKHKERINILEWILTDMNHQIEMVSSSDGTTKGNELCWYPKDIYDTVEYTCRLLYEYFGVDPTSRITVPYSPWLV